MFKVIQESVKKRILLFLIVLMLTHSSHAFGLKWSFNKLIADTIYIVTAADSVFPPAEKKLKIEDQRLIPSSILGIQQTKKLRFIPVDQYVALKEPLTVLLTRYLQKDSVTFDQTLIIDNLSLWYDDVTWFSQVRVLNGYSRIVGENGKTLWDWQWELREQPHKKQKPEENIAILVDRWMAAQSQALKAMSDDSHISPFRYRRQMIPWLDVIRLRDGYILIGHLTIDFPYDDLHSFVRGSPGMYYRKSSIHESIAIGGKDQQWYYRLSPVFLGRLNASLRFGFNSFNPHKFDYIGFWNIVMINLGLTASIEYRPVFYRGIFLGAGIHQALNLLPDAIKRLETGIMLSAGIVLP